MIASPLAELAQGEAHIQLCGFGPIAAAARSVQAIAQVQPREVLLLGIAGGLSDELELGSALEFTQVLCYGVGAGSQEEYCSASKLGWPQWSMPPSMDVLDGMPLTADIGDCIELRKTAQPEAAQLLTCCAASASPRDLELRRSAFPKALAEDMEGFAVAVACHLCQVPLRIFRGISNRAGHRHAADWKVELAMQSAVELCISSLNQS